MLLCRPLWEDRQCWEFILDLPCAAFQCVWVPNAVANTLLNSAQREGGKNCPHLLPAEPHKGRGCISCIPPPAQEGSNLPHL